MNRVVLACLGSREEVSQQARALRDAGAEVVHMGPTTLDRLVATVLQEDPDAVAVDERAAEVAAALAERDAGEIPVLSVDEVLARMADTPRDRTHHHS